MKIKKNGGNKEKGSDFHDITFYFYCKST